MPPSLASALRKLKSDGTGQCLYLVRYCSQTPRKFACFVLPAWDGRRYLPRSTKGMFVYFYYLYFHSQGKPASTAVPPCQVPGSSRELRSPTNNNNSTTTQLRFLPCKYLYVGALVWGRRSPYSATGSSYWSSEAVKRWHSHVHHTFFVWCSLYSQRAFCSVNFFF